MMICWKICSLCEALLTNVDKIRAEIEQLRLCKAQFLTSDNKVCIDSQAVLDVIDKYKADYERSQFKKCAEEHRQLVEWLKDYKRLKEQEPKAEKVIEMRDATSEERESVDRYIDSISKSTGVDFWDVNQKPTKHRSG